MNLSWITGALRTVRHAAVKHAPDILMAVGTVSVGTGMVYAVKAGPRAVKAIEKEKDISGEPLDWKGKVKATWRIYTPPTALTLLGIGCFWGAHAVDIKRQALLAVSCSTMEATLQEYQRKVIELMGEKQHREVRESVAEEKIKRVEPENVGALPPGASDIWYVIDGNNFPSSYLKIKEAENNFNHRLLHDTYCNKAELYWMLDPERRWLKPKYEDFHMGWNNDRLLVLWIDHPFGPVATITYEDKDGIDYPPTASFMDTL